jgi:hypothetical protein
LKNPKFSQDLFAITALGLGKALRWLAVGVVGLAALFLLPAIASAGPLDPCRDGNLLPNCNFNEFVGSPPRQVPNGWTPFVLSGDLDFRQVLGEECHSFDQPSCLIMRSDGLVFKAGLWRQVGGLQPGATYRAAIGWGGPNAPTDSFGRQLGIDPTGGTDPGSPNVIWGPKHFGDGRSLSYDEPYSAEYPSIDVSAAAQGDTLTVFVLVDHTYSTGNNFIYLDQIGLRLDPNAAPPSPTAVPPTATPLSTAIAAPVRVAPSATPSPTATPTDEPTATPSPTPTDTPTPTATPTYTPSPTATPSPTLTPTASPTLAARPTATPQPIYVELGRASQRQPALLLYSGFGSLILALLAGAVIWWLLRGR